MLTTIHLGIVIVTVLFVLYSDEQALAWTLGKSQKLSAKRMQFLHHAVTVGLTFIMLTGGLLYERAPQAYFSKGVFDIKMIAILALILNTYAIGKYAHVAIERSFASLSSKERMPLFISGAVSFLGWVTAVICGLSL